MFTRYLHFLKFSSTAISRRLNVWRKTKACLKQRCVDGLSLYNADRQKVRTYVHFNVRAAGATHQGWTKNEEWRDEWEMTVREILQTLRYKCAFVAASIIPIVFHKSGNKSSLVIVRPQLMGWVSVCVISTAAEVIWFCSFILINMCAFVNLLQVKNYLHCKANSASW